MRKKVITALILTSAILCGCGGLSAKDLTDYYAELAKQKAEESAREAASTAASNVNKAIDENETASKVRDGVTTAGEYAQDAYDYATDENTINKAKQTAGQTVTDSKNFFEYMLNKLGIQWDEFKQDFVKSPDEFDTNYFDDMENISEYDFYGNYKNIFKEAKGIDTSSNGTAMKQLKEAISNASESAKNTAQSIKQNHDSKHPKTTQTQKSDNEGSTSAETETVTPEVTATPDETTKSIGEILTPLIPEYSSTQYCIVNDNVPFFDESELTLEAFETYSELDRLGRCGVAYANICKEIMPTQERESIGAVKPTGFIQKRYDILKNDENPYGYLWARCHLIAFTLAGENANPQNLITGTLTAFNMDGMEPFELMTSYYVKSTNHHVLYRVTPIFYGSELVARGVLMEAQSVEDDKLSFCVFVYNAAPGIKIDYATGESSLLE